MKRKIVFFIGILTIALFSVYGMKLWAAAETEDEALKVLAAKGDQTPDVLTEAVFIGFDKDGNKLLDMDEFAKIMIQLFAELDTNHDDVVELSELPRGWNPELEKMDTNKDKQIEFSELVTAIKDGFKERDVNGDSLLSYEEVKTQIEKNKSGKV